MNFEQAITDREQLGRYETLKRQKAQYVAHVEQWMTAATALHGATADTAEKAEIVALRDELVADLKTALGV